MSRLTLPPDKQQLLERIVDDLLQIEGVKAVVLGGSYASGLATAESDLDLGIYYTSDTPFQIEAVRELAGKYAAGEMPTVTGFYDWGPWVNGGAWIKTGSGPVDFIYKNIQQVAETIEQAKKGNWENHFDQQPPYGFSSIIYLAETYYCVPLYDPDKVIETFKKEVKDYPPALRQSVVQQSLWAAEFTIWQAERLAMKNDIYNTVGCLTRAVKHIVTAVFALNRIYPLGDKRAMELIECMEIRPHGFSGTVSEVLSCRPDSLPVNVDTLRVLFESVKALASGLYTPYFNLK